VTAVGVPTEDDDGKAAAAAPAKKREPAHSALKASVRDWVREYHSCTPDELHGFITSKETNALLKEVKEKMPQWWEGWPEQPDGFTPLADMIDNAHKAIKEAS